MVQRLRPQLPPPRAQFWSLARAFGSYTPHGQKRKSYSPNKKKGDQSLNSEEASKSSLFTEQNEPQKRTISQSAEALASGAQF